MNLLDRVKDDMQRNGRSVIVVLPDPNSKDVNDAFAYTIGNSIIGLPELLMIGVHGPEGVLILNTLSRQMIRRGGEYKDGEHAPVGNAKFHVCMIAAKESVKDDYTIQATNMMGRKEYDVQQVVVPDQHGRFPWDPDCERPYADVVVHAARKRKTH